MNKLVLKIFQNISGFLRPSNAGILVQCTSENVK